MKQTTTDKITDNQSANRSAAGTAGNRDKFESDMGWTSSQNATEATEGVSQRLESGMKSAKDAFSTASHKVADGYGVAREQFSKASTQVEGLIKENPMVAVCAAVGLGWLVGRYLSSRSSNNHQLNQI